jgi:hypothetical protein
VFAGTKKSWMLIIALPHHHRALSLFSFFLATAEMDIPTTTHYKDAFEFVQRYIVAVLYYSTGGDSSWTHTDLGFLSEDDVCDWNQDKEITIRATATGEETVVTRPVGVMCDDYGQVNYIYLRTYFLTLLLLLLLLLSLFVCACRGVGGNLRLSCYRYPYCFM